MSTRWYVVQLQPQLRETADFHLRRQNFELLIPLLEIRKSRKVTVTEPMFRGYGFVQFDAESDHWGPINGTRGVVGLLPRHSLVPQPMPVGFVERFAAGPVKEADFIEVFDNYFPGITEVEVSPDHKLLAGRRGLVVGVREKLLQVSFSASGGNAVWLSRDVLSPVGN